MAGNNEKNIIEFSLLEERIKTNTEVHEKYTQAFTEIMDLLERNGTRILEYKSEIKETNEEVSKLIADLFSHNENAKNLLKEINEGFNEQGKNMQLIIIGMDAQKLALDNLLTPITDIINKLSSHDINNDGQLVNIKDALKKIEAVIQEHCDDNVDLPTQVSVLYKERQAKKSALNKFLWILGIMGLMTGIILSLIQAGVIQIYWFPPVK